MEIPNQIFQSKQDIVFKTKSGDLIEASKVNMSNGIITSVENIVEDTFDRHDIEIFPNVLYVKDVGSLTPRTRVVYKDQDYVLLFGWHRNISNQHIYSWFLRSLEESVPDKTLYKEMIDEIDIIHFR